MIILLGDNLTFDKVDSICFFGKCEISKYCILKGVCFIECSLPGGVVEEVEVAESPNWH